MAKRILSTPCPPGATVTARSASARPTAKVTAGAVAGALATVVLAFVAAYKHQDLPTGTGESCVLLITVLAGYFTHPRPGEVVLECEEQDHGGTHELQ